MNSHSIFESLETLYDDNVIANPLTFERQYAKMKDLDAHLVDVYNETSQVLGYGLTLDQAIELDRGRELHIIQSVVGDDEYSTTDSISLGPAIIGFGPIINGIKVSWKDSGISHYLGNYAEGWVINPPSSEATFEATNRRHARSGVPFTLDPVKLKLLSPVRKQSPTWELDLESKLTQLAEIASWTDRDWFTFDYHQMCLILANVVFDFEDAKTFPYLFKTEGGCGGQPPYGNLDTVYSAMHFYTRGKSRRGILGVMEEAVGVNTGNLAPKDTFFLRNSHLANMGDKVWLRYESAYRTLLDQGSLSRSEAEDLLREQEAEGLPDHIRSLGTEIEPHSFVVGSNLSALRSEGLIMSELDVKAALDARVRIDGLLKDEPIGLLKQRQEEEAAAFRGKHLKILSQISDIDPQIREDLKAKGLMMPSAPDQAFRDLTNSYYSMRTEQYARYSSFFYTDTIRIFKRDEIRDVLEAPSRAVRADFALTDSFPEKWVEKFLEENSEERDRRQRVHDWFNSAPLSELLYQPLPTGVGTDDARIARGIIDLVRNTRKDEDVDLFVVILFSGDRQLARLSTQLVRESGIDTSFRLLSFDRTLYTRVCLDGVAEYNQTVFSGRTKDPRRPWYGLRKPGQNIMYYNYIMKRLWPMPQSVVSQIYDLAAELGAVRPLVHVEYDYPNMERGLETIRLDPRTGTVEEYGGGYLERRTLRSFGQAECWSKQSLDEIYAWADFDIVRSKRHFPLGKGRVRDEKIYGFSSTSRATYARVDSWRKATRRSSQQSWRTRSEISIPERTP